MKNTVNDALWEILYELAEEATGQSYTSQQKSGILKSNFSRRMKELKLDELDDYLNYLTENDSEWSIFLTLSTIHTTSWFREDPHYKILSQEIERHIKLNAGTFRLLCAACSTGQEAYSAALVLEGYRKANPHFDYKVDAFDVDPVSVNAAARCVYNNNSISKLHSTKYAHFIHYGKNQATGNFTLSKHIRNRVEFRVDNVLNIKNFNQKYNWIMCRNVLIYFSSNHVLKAIRNLKKLMAEDGRLCIGHSESFDTSDAGLRLTSNSVYIINDKAAATPNTSLIRPIENIKDNKVALIVDDSSVIRKKLSKIMGQASFHILEAANTDEADNMIKRHKIDFLTVDLHMPNLDGVSWIKKIRSQGCSIPAVMVSDSTLEDAPQILSILGCEIHDFFDKKTLHSHPEYLIEKALALVTSSNKDKSKRRAHTNQKPTDIGFEKADLILIGASTGGTTALVELLSNLQKPCPPIVVVQHITPSFSKPFAERLAFHSGLKLGTPEQNTVLKHDTIYLSHGDYHIGVSEDRSQLVVKVSDEPPISRHRPSVDYLFSSGANLKRKNILAILMTGMGSDGAAGMLKLLQANAFTACQDEDSCVVFGMPKEAIHLNAHRFVGNIQDLRQLIIKSCHHQIFGRVSA